MSSIGLTITINKYTNYFETKQYYVICDTLFSTKEKLLELLTEHINKINIDYPLMLEDFDYEWFGQQYVKSNSFSYKIFMNDEWNEPWELQDIYDEILERIVKQEIQNAPDFTEEITLNKDTVELDTKINIDDIKPIEEIQPNISKDELNINEISDEMKDLNEKFNAIIESSKFCIS